MKNTIITSLLLVFIGVSAYLYLNQPKQIPAVPIISKTEISLKAKIDSLTKYSSANSELLSKTEIQLAKANSDKQILRKELSTAYDTVETLQQRYRDNKTLAGCDSLVTAQSSVISKQKQLIGEYRSDSILYSDRENLLKGIVVSKDSIIFAQNKILDIKNTDIQNLICAQDWKFKHRFWAWVFGWKCKP